MKYAIYDNQEAAEADLPKVQAAVDAVHITGTPRVIMLAYQLRSGAYPGKWCVGLPVDIAVSGVIVDSVEPPVEPVI